MIKKQLLLFLIILSSLAGYSQTITPQWKALVNGVSEFHAGNKVPTAGYDSLMYMRFQRLVFKDKADTVNHDGFTTISHFNLNAWKKPDTVSILATKWDLRRIPTSARYIKNQPDDSPDSTQTAGFNIDGSGWFYNGNSKGLVSATQFELDNGYESDPRIVIQANSMAMTDSAGNISVFKLEKYPIDDSVHVSGQYPLLFKQPVSILNNPVNQYDAVRLMDLPGGGIGMGGLQQSTDVNYTTTKPLVTKDHAVQGDSTSFRYYRHVGDSESLAKGFADNTSQSDGYPYKLARLIGGALTNQSRAGRSFQMVTVGDSSMFNIRDSIPGPQTNKDILILSVINDISGDTTLFTPTLVGIQMPQIISKVISKGWVNTQILIAIPTYENSTAAANHTLNNSYRHNLYHFKLDSIATATGVHFYDAWDPVKIQNNISHDMLAADSLHLTMVGQTFVANLFATFISTFTTVYPYSPIRNNTNGANQISGDSFVYGDENVKGVLTASSGLNGYTNYGYRFNFPKSVAIAMEVDDGATPSTGLIPASNTAAAVFASGKARSDIFAVNSHTTDFSKLKFVKSIGTLSTPTGITSTSQGIGAIEGYIFDGTTANLTARIVMTADGTQSTGVSPQRIGLFTGATNSQTEGFRMNSNQLINMPFGTVFGGTISSSLTSGYITNTIGKARFTQTDTWGVNDSLAFHKNNGAITLVKALPAANGGLNTTTAPTTNQIPIATGSTTYAPTTISGDLTNALGVFTIGANKVTYAKMQAVTTNKLLGSGSGTAVAEITLGTNLSFSGTTLNAASSTDNILSKTADYTIVSGDFVAGKKTTLDLYVDATSGNVTITLPSAATFAGYTIYITKTDASANTITVNTLLGGNSITSQYQVKQCNSNATSWYNH